MHREDGPAITWHDGATEWYRHGDLHRIDGPALIYDNDKSWWLADEEYSFEEWLELTPISEEEKLMIKLKYA